MAKKRSTMKYRRRDFLKQAAVGGVLTTAESLSALPTTAEPLSAPKDGMGNAAQSSSPFAYPRIFAGPNLNMIAFPLGGIGTGTISLGGRGQLRDWEIFNRPDKGNSPDYAFGAVWAQIEGQEPVARILESRLTPPYEGSSGLGANNVPGLPRLESTTFTGAYPFARIEFRDPKLPLRLTLESFTPLVPLDVEASGLPVAILRYKLKNPNSVPVKASVAWSLQNPIGMEGRQTTFRRSEKLAGLYMENPFLPANDPLKGSLVLGVVDAPPEGVSYLRGWKRALWWDGPLSFWDDFTTDGALDSNSLPLSPIGSVAVTQSIGADGESSVTFILTWHFPNRTPARCGWTSPSEEDKRLVVGNAYCQRFRNAWEVATFLAKELPSLEARTRKFASAVETSTLPPAVLDAAMSNLSTLRTNTAFRTADGEFHAFEGCDDQKGCCHGSCTHVWNYEQATAFVFPALSRSLRESEFLRNTTENGLMGFRSYLPDGKKVWQEAAADGQMGCLMKLYRDWQLSGDTDWLRRLWPDAKRALEFAWIANGWDGNRDGVMEGVQHNTYDVEFYGPNPLCGVWYLGALRAAAEMAGAVGDKASASEYQHLFESGSKWIDLNLFNGQFYIQKVAGRRVDQIAAGTRMGLNHPGESGGADSEKPDYQMGEACLCDQLVGQYMSHVVGLGYLLGREQVRTTLQSIYENNYRPNLGEHASVQRTYALNDDAGVVVATYPIGKRPEIPFPYFAEVWNGLEYQLAAHMIYEGMIDEALTVVESVRRRHDGERRNPWNEPECGHHYARPMASWAVLVALSGFRYSAVQSKLTLTPRLNESGIRTFWTVPSGWGTFEFSQTVAGLDAQVAVAEGSLKLTSLALRGIPEKSFKAVSANMGSPTVRTKLQDAAQPLILFEQELHVVPDSSLRVRLRI
jgi:non-lysosomal glucosylceramidase